MPLELTVALRATLLDRKPACVLDARVGRLARGAG